MDTITLTSETKRHKSGMAVLPPWIRRSGCVLLVLVAVGCESPVGPGEGDFAVEFGLPLVEYENLGSWAWLTGGREVIVAYYGASGAELRAIDVDSRAIRTLAEPLGADGLIFDVQVRDPYVYYAVSDRRLYRVPIDGSSGPEEVFVQDPCDCTLWENWAVSADHVWLAKQLAMHGEDGWAFTAIVTNLETGTAHAIERPPSWLGRLSVAPDGSAFVDVNDRITLVEVPGGERVEVIGPAYWEINEFEFGFPWDVIVRWNGATAVARYALGEEFFEHPIGSDPVLVTSVADVHNGRWSSSSEHVAGWRSHCTERHERMFSLPCLESEHRLVVQNVSTGSEMELGRIVSPDLGPFLHPPVFAPGDQAVAFVTRARSGSGSMEAHPGLYVISL